MDSSRTLTKKQLIKHLCIYNVFTMLLISPYLFSESHWLDKIMTEGSWFIVILLIANSVYLLDDLMMQKKEAN